jgi:hypothetical protein
VTAAQSVAASATGSAHPPLGLQLGPPPQPAAAAARLEPILELEEKSWRLACVVRAMSRRGDVARTRARILLALIAMRPPPDARGWQRWYVPGAVARLGPEGLRRVWSRIFGEAPPCVRTVRQHLSDLVAAGALVRSPGDWLAGVTRDGQPIRWPDTLHLLESDADAQWWARVGRARAAAHPRAAWDPGTWRRFFAGWRTEARQLELFADEGASGFPASSEAAKPVYAAQTVTAAEAARPPDLPERLVEASRAGVAEVLGVLRAAGGPVLGRNGWALARSEARTRAAAALLARALARGDRVRDLAAWLVAAARRARGDELANAAPWVARNLPRGAVPCGHSPNQKET